MTFKTLLDCRKCPHLAQCDAHISGGTHKHDEGLKPCKLVFESKVNDFEIV